ncbi:MAG: hypothetical protein ACREAC_26395, partial [Blastocatellia bacterium]
MTSTPVVSDQAGTGLPSNTVTLAVVSQAIIDVSFSPASVLVGGQSTFALTLTNPNQATALANGGFITILPPGIAVTDESVSQCNGTLTVSSN